MALRLGSAKHRAALDNKLIALSATWRSNPPPLESDGLSAENSFNSAAF
jgi:hypothetical protein